MSNFDPIFQSAAQQYGIDPNMLKAIAMKESSMNPQAVNPDGGASGLMGFTPDNAKAYGIDPLKPEQAIPAAAKMFSESLARSGGDVSQAVADHFAGPDPKLHGPKTDEYVKQVAAIFNGQQNQAPASQQQRPSVDAWLSGDTKPAAQASGPNVDDWLGSVPAVHEAPFIDESHNPNYKSPPGTLKVNVSGTVDSPGVSAQSQNNPISQLGHQLGLTGRAAITGLTGLPNMLGDAANSAINLGTGAVNSLTGSNIPQMQLPSQATQELMNQAGVAQPQNATERVVQNVASSMAGVSPSVAMGNLLAKSSVPVAQAVGTGLQQLPGMQITGSAGAGLGSGVARENGVGPMGQMAAAVLGGGVGAITPSAALAVSRMPGAMIKNVNGVAAPFVNPQKYVGQQLAQALGSDSSSVAENLRNIPQYVPGSLPTTAQAGANPLLVATEKASANSNPSLKIALAQREADNNNARWQALNGVSLTPEELEAAKEARATITGPMYDEAHQQTANVGKGFINFAQRPAVQKAMADADILARNEGVSLKWPTPTDRAISGQALDYTARALSDKISTLQRSGSPQEVRALTDAKNYIKSWMEQYVPGVGEAASDYQALSSPINTMEAGQQIAGSLGTRSMDASGLPQIQLSPYKTALIKALKDQPYGIDEGAHQTLQGIGQDLQRATISNSLKSPGSDTAYNIAANGWLAKQLYGKEFQGSSGIGKTTGALIAAASGHPFVGLGILGGGANKIAQSAGANLNAQLQELLLNPEKLLPYLDAQKGGNQTAQALSVALRRNINQGLVGTAVGSKP